MLPLIRRTISYLPLSTLTPYPGAMKPVGMITKTIKLDQVAEEGFKTLIEDKDNHVKILVDVGSGI